MSELSTFAIDTLSRSSFDLPFLLLYEQSADKAGFTLIGKLGLAGKEAVAEATKIHAGFTVADRRGHAAEQRGVHFER